MTKLIKGFSNYSITLEGVITNIKTGLVKSQWLGANGYYHVDLQQEGVRKKVSIHRLLATHYLDNPEGKRTVNHIDGDKKNNFLGNLEWATDSENMQHAYDNNLNRATNKRISDMMLNEILYRFLSGTSLTSIVKDYDISLPTISTYMKDYTISIGQYPAFLAEKQRQKGIRAEVTGYKERILIDLQMLHIETEELLQTFNSITEAKEYLERKSCGPISNVLAGRQNTAYGYKWRKV